MKKFLAAAILTAFFICIFSGCNDPAKTPLSNSIDSSEETTSEETTNHEEIADFPESYMTSSENYFDYQPGLECAAFSSAYFLRSLGEEADGLTLFETFPGKIAEGGVMPSGIETFFTDKGFSAQLKADGTVDTIKELISRTEMPVIVFIHVEEPYESTHNTHYVPIVGYDKDNFYFAESLHQYANCKDETGVQYNRKTDIPKFMKLWENIDGMWDYPYFEIVKSDA